MRFARPLIGHGPTLAKGDTMQRSLRFIASIALLATGCQSVALGDSIDLSFDLNPLDGPSDLLHSPYVAGSSFTVYVTHPSADDTVGWSIGTSDTGIARIDSTDGDGDSGITTLGEGTVDFIVRDERGLEVHRVPVDVLQPDAAELRAHGPMLVGQSALERDDPDRIQILVGGQATFQVIWSHEGTRLHGRGALSTEAPDAVTAEARETFLFENREWLSLTVHEAGEHLVELRANGVAVRTVTVVGVTEDDVRNVVLHGQDETNAAEGQTLNVIGQAYDTDGQPIYGVEYRWDLDGVAAEGEGDLYRYTFDPTQVRMLGAHHGDTDVFAEIQASEGFVSSTNNLCSVGHGSTPPPAMLLLLLPALVWRVRRRAGR